MKLLAPAISRLARLRLPAIDGWRLEPITAQYDVWQDLLAAGQYTEYGRQYGFSNIHTLRQWKEQVPLTQYEDLKPLIDRMLQGEENILWNTPVRWFAKSSGTTSDKSKFIPVSDESLQDNHYKVSKDVLAMYYATRPDSDLLTGKGLIIGGSHEVNQLNEDIQFGDLSAVVMQNSPFWVNWMRTPDLSIILMAEWEEKIEKLAHHTIHENVTSMSGVPTWLLVLLRRILEITGKANIKEVWPSLELYMHGGVSFVPYRKAFEEIIGAPINYLEMYNASEGFFAAQDDTGAEGMLLMLDHGIFYEFIPAGEWDNPAPHTIQLDEVELGANYGLVISTNGGLWRYIPGDTIQFTSIAPFRIRVSGRMKHFINAFGEELIIDNADRAIAAACVATGLSVNDYTAAPVYFSGNSNGAHEWIIEFQQVPEDVAPFAEALDAALKAANSDYEAKRHKDIALRGPQIQAVPAGTFERWLQSKGKLGGQHKVPRLSNGRTVLEDVRRFLEHSTGS